MVFDNKFIAGVDNVIFIKDSAIEQLFDVYLLVEF
jgi:hypothetical protein